MSSLLFQMDRGLESGLDVAALSPAVRQAFAEHELRLSPEAKITFDRAGGGRWLLADSQSELDFEVRRENGHLNIYRIFPLSLSELDL